MNDRGFNSKQMGDACEMLVAGELTLAGIPALRVPDSWPGYDVIAHPPGGSPQRISVKSRSKERSHFINFEPAEFDWLAIVLLVERRPHFFIVPTEVAASDELSRPRSLAQIAREPGWRWLPLTAAYIKKAPFNNNFELKRLSI
jgi:hypothetical protein